MSAGRKQTVRCTLSRTISWPVGISLFWTRTPQLTCQDSGYQIEQLSILANR